MKHNLTQVKQLDLNFNQTWLERKHIQVKWNKFESETVLNGAKTLTENLSICASIQIECKYFCDNINKFSFDQQ